jgi:hypothetical protein
MEKTGQVKQINQEIKNLEKIRNEIQSGCTHKEKTIKFDDTNTPRVMCCNCEKNLSYPSRQELEVFLTGK